MKKYFSLNPIPKRVFNISFKFMLFLIFGTFSGSEMKAIPGDWPSTDGNECCITSAGEFMQLTCHGSVQISLDQSGIAIVTPQMLLVDFYPSYAKFKVVINQTSTNQVNCLDIGKSLTATVIDTTNGMMCWSRIVVEDKLRPAINCNADTISCTNDPFTVDYSAFVSISDNCDVNVTSFYDITLDLLTCNNSRYSSIVHLKWTATDDYGNSSTCLQDIYFKKSSVDSIVFPEDTIVYCPNADLEATGVPTLFGDTVNHFCQLLATHADDSIIICGGSVKINRLWTVMDWCNGTSRSETQEILVSDTTRPEIICPGNLTLYSDVLTCRVDYRIPFFTATDACCPAELLLLVVRVDSSYFLLPGQAISLGNGLHSLNYIAIDPCGNSDTCTSYILVKDKISPSLICPPALIVSIGLQGSVLLTADFIAGKGLVTDNCCLDSIFVRRMTMACNRPQDTLFNNAIEFCCDDIGDTLMMVLKATDCSGNMNFCMIQIIVQDKNPSLNSPCPSPINLPCDTNYLDLNVSGNYYTVNSCLDTIIANFIDIFQPDSCGEGVITRDFYFILPGGIQQQGCQQSINIFNDYIFNPSHIVWPGDIYVDDCLNFHPDSIQSYPRMSVDDCGSVYFSFIDLQLQTDIDGCEYFDRVWTAYSACSQQSVKDTQRISLIDLAGASLLIPNDTIVANMSGACVGWVTLPPAVLNGCTGNTVISNSYNSEGEDASDTYPVGTTLVVFTALNSCDTLRDTLTVIVQDQESPFLECDLFTFDMQPNDSVIFTARSLLLSYSDNCTPEGLLNISFTNGDFNDTVRIITCDDLSSPPDTFNYQIFVEDQYGNIDSCVSFAIITDSHLYCPNTIRAADVGGIITDHKGNPMKDVKMDLIGTNQSLLTDEFGHYVFNDLITNHEYIIRPVYDKKWLEGLTALDIVKIQRHILGLEPFDTPYKWIAADMDNNGRVSSTDIVWLRKLILGLELTVPKNKSWRFINKNFRFQNPGNPLAEEAVEEAILKGNWNDTIVNFDAIKTGDVSSIQGFITAEERLRKTDLTISNRQFKELELVTVDLYLEKEMDLEGMQLCLMIEPDMLEFYKVTEFLNDPAGKSLGPDEYSCNGKDLAAIILRDQAFSKPYQGKILSLVFRAKQNGMIKDALKPGNLFSNEMYLKQDVPVKILFSYKEISKENQDLVNWFIDPNPFKQHCILQFESETYGHANLSLMDLNGKVLVTRQHGIDKGKNQLFISSVDIPEPGTYLYYLRYGDKTYSGKLLKIN